MLVSSRRCTCRRKRNRLRYFVQEERGGGQGFASFFQLREEIAASLDVLSPQNRLLAAFVAPLCRADRPQIVGGANEAFGRG